MLGWEAPLTSFRREPQPGCGSDCLAGLGVQSAPGPRPRG
jgi:hypothetical protein